MVGGLLKSCPSCDNEESSAAVSGWVGSWEPSAFLNLNPRTESSEATGTVVP